MSRAGRIVNRAGAARRLPGPLSMLFPCIQMPNARLTTALSRLEAALTRVEAAARAPTPGADAAALAALAERHDRLRAGAAEALERLDRLIGAAGSGAA